MMQDKNKTNIDLKQWINFSTVYLISIILS